MAMVTEGTEAVNGAGSGEKPLGSPGRNSHEPPPALLEKPEGLPPGKYTLIGWDIDATGKRLIDEICQIAAYTPSEQYFQYIMPHGDLNPIARRRHNLRVVTVGRYRMLKETITNKFLKTKSEITALTDFLEWLEKMKGENESIILIYHEPRRLHPIMLLEALLKYNLLDRFKSVVSGFCDGYALAANKCADTVKSVSLRVLARVLLDAEGPPADGAQHSASAAYRILDHLAQGDQADVSGSSVELARVWTRPVHTELKALNDLKHLLERQNTFRAVFSPLLDAPSVVRRRATQLRKHLAVAGLQFEELQEAWNQAQLDGITKKMQELSTTAKEDEIKELVEIFDCFFDPAKEAKSFKQMPRNKNRNNTSTRGDGAGDSDSATPPEQQSPTHVPEAGDSSEAVQD